MTLWEIIACMSIPSAFTGFWIWMLKRHIDKAEKKRAEREAARVKNEVLIVQAVGASFALGEASAEAIQTGKHNGELSAALKYAKEIKHKQKDFLTELGIKNLYEKEA